MKQWVELLESSVIVALVLAGIGGLSYHLFRIGGWINTSLDSFWKLEARHVLIAIPVIIAAVYLWKLWHGGRSLHSKTSVIPNIVLYALMATGAYFIGHFALSGTI